MAITLSRVADRSGRRGNRHKTLLKYVYRIQLSARSRVVPFPFQPKKWRFLIVVRPAPAGPPTPANSWRGPTLIRIKYQGKDALSTAYTALRPSTARARTCDEIYPEPSYQKKGLRTTAAGFP